MILGILAAVHVLLALGFVAHVLLRRKEPPSMMAWILAICLIPYIGPLWYVVFGENRIRRKAHRRRRRIEKRVPRRMVADGRSSMDATGASNQIIAKTAEDFCGFPLSRGNQVEVLDDGEQIFNELANAIGNAERYVHLQYYIWRDDRIGTRLRDLLIERAKAGVQVRLLLDSYGSSALPQSFLKPLKDAGAQAAWFLTQFPIKRRWSLHLRNHRKLALIDGRCAYLGSQNVGDEYAGGSGSGGGWYDCHLRICGPVLEHLQVTFAEDWAFACGESLTNERYYETAIAGGAEGDRENGEGELVQSMASGPDTDTRQVEGVFFAAFVNARKSISIATPYFVPSEVILESLRYAARNGAKIRIVHPRETDRKIVLWAGRSFYKELFAAGIEIFELPTGMLHSKIAIVDDRWACVGSTNMDIRSFRLNFENSTLLYDCSAIRNLQKLCDHYCAKSERMDPSEWENRGNRDKLIEGAARLAAPLL